MIDLLKRFWLSLTESDHKEPFWVSGCLPMADEIVAIERGNSWYEQASCDKDGQWWLVEVGMWGYDAPIEIDPPARWSYE